MKFLIDECLSPSIAKTLLEAGWDAVHINERGLSGQPDEQILSCALEEGRVLISADTDFGELLMRSGAPAPSVLLLRRSVHLPKRQAEVILANLPEITGDLMSGAIVVLREDHIRVRSLQSEI